MHQLATISKSARRPPISGAAAIFVGQIALRVESDQHMGWLCVLSRAVEPYCVGICHSNVAKLMPALSLPKPMRTGNPYPLAPKPRQLRQMRY